MQIHTYHNNYIFCVYDNVHPRVNDMIIIMRGTTCSGKDTFIQSEFGELPNHILSSDNFREMLFGDMKEQRKNKMVFQYIYDVLEQRLQCRVPFTVMNSTNLKFKDIENIIELSKKYKAPIMVISILPPALDVLKERNMKRAEASAFFVPEHVIENHHKRYHDAMELFIKEAMYNELFNFTEIDQDYNVVRVVEKVGH